MAEKKVYQIKISGALVEVPAEVYLTYYRMRRRWSAQEERDTYNGVISYDAMDTDETLGEETIPDSDAPSVEDMVVNKLLREKLRRCLGQLDESDRMLIFALYYEGLSERQLSKEIHIPQQTISDRKLRVLARLKKLLET